ncbi:ABC transporter ATP-binding protein [Acetivibrio ethanolgignens]|uniref:ABC transporter ATP-binding protein n=1 Tax=Acetivibrio ethanolgignens TaxID=290052 RepID=A0A0V8QF04_9FIRM|nr:ABC transporter ATP-binding protein [Acetivibrio ethanolgignens]KSV59122.1 ABC transporter ATP-binding protein [Acetivibrio ethanolgignens]
MLKINDLHTYYGAIHALKGINMEVEKGEVVSLIGSNGAGKTTLLTSIIGVTRAKQGAIVFNGKEITQAPTHSMTKMKISISPEGREVFPELTVEENLRLGAYIVKNKGEIATGYDRVYNLFPRLKERYKQQAGTLSGGEQQMLAVGRALMSSPELLLLDEPSLGLAPNFVLMIFDMIKEINKQGVTILLIEQNANIALSASDRAYVIENGKVTMSGDAKKIASDPQIKRAYLGIG